MNTAGTFKPKPLSNAEIKQELYKVERKMHDIIEQKGLDDSHPLYGALRQITETLETLEAQGY
jgi:hypothetical protein